MNNTPSVSLETTREIVRLSELYLEGTVRFSLAADARAMQMSSMLAAASTGLIGAGLALLSSDGFLNQGHFIVGIAALSCGICFLAALYCGLKAAKPRAFHVAGNYLDEWRNDKDLYGGLQEALLGQAEVYQNQINKNRRQLTENAESILMLLRLLGAAPIAGLAAGLLAWIITLL